MKKSEHGEYVTNQLGAETGSEELEYCQLSIPRGQPTYTNKV